MDALESIVAGGENDLGRGTGRRGADEKIALLLDQTTGR